MKILCYNGANIVENFQKCGKVEKLWKKIIFFQSSNSLNKKKLKHFSTNSRHLLLLLLNL